MNNLTIGRVTSVVPFVLVVIAIAAGAWYWSARHASAPVQTVAPQVAELNAELYPLYTGTTWGAEVATTSPDYGAVVEVESAAFTGITNIAEKSTPFTKYYHDKLTAAGWSLDMSREAGGPGAEVSVYTKGNQFVVVSFHSVFTVQHPSAPSECPCDLQFTLMTGVAPATSTTGKNDAIRLTSPLPNSEISSPLTITGEARGSWYFEASFPILLTDWDGKIIAQGTARAQGDWMTTDFVPFTATLTFNTADIRGQYSNKGSLILKKDNPSGLPEHDDALEIPVLFK